MRRARALATVALLLAASPSFAARKPLGTGERIDVNRASVVELMRLPGVGRKKAEAIAAHRARAPFRRLEDLLSVKGFSPTWLEKQRQHLAVGPAAAAAPPPVGAGFLDASQGIPAAARNAISASSMHAP
jgi:competence protein ComEA